MLGQIVEVVTGQPLQGYFGEHIFGARLGANRSRPIRKTMRRRQP